MTDKHLPQPPAGEFLLFQSEDDSESQPGESPPGVHRLRYLA